MIELQPLPLQVGDKITIYSVSDGAMTTREEATVMEVFDTPQFRPSYANQSPSLRGQWRFGVMKLKVKRKEHYISCKPYCTLIVPGWHHVLRSCDVFNSFSINACINLQADEVSIRDLVSQNINPNFTAHDILIAVPDAGVERLVYPEAPTQHAVIERMREGLGKEVSQ